MLCNIYRVNFKFTLGKSTQQNISQIRENKQPITELYTVEISKEKERKKRKAK